MLSSSRPSHCYLPSPRRFYHPQAHTLCPLELHAATFTLPSPSSAILPPSSSQAVRPRNPSHPDCYPQALKLCALELQTFPLLPSISSAILPLSGFQAVRPRAPRPPHHYSQASNPFAFLPSNFKHSASPPLSLRESRYLRAFTPSALLPLSASANPEPSSSPANLSPPPQDDLRCLHPPHLTAASTDKYAPA
jgi:hypothetical protein